MKMLLNIIKLLHILLFHNNFLKIYKILQKNPLYILYYFILLLYMIYSSNMFCYNYKYLDEKTFIVNIMKNYCNTYYADNYRHLYNQRFYDSNINKYILIMILTNKMLKSDFMTINYIYGKLIDINERYRFIDYILFLGSIDINDRRNINIYYQSYKMNAEFILFLIEYNNL